MSIIKGPNKPGDENFKTPLTSSSGIIKKSYISHLFPKKEEEEKTVFVPATQTPLESINKIKKETAPITSQIDKVIIEEAKQKASKIINDSRQETRKLIEESKLYCQSAFSQAQMDGFKQGKIEGREAGEEEVQNLIKEWKNMAVQIIKERERLIKESEKEIAQLALKIAGKIINKEIALNKEVVLGVVEDALGKIKSREQITLKVNPQDLEAVKEDRTRFMAMIEGLKKFDIQTDPQIEQGGCVIETDLGNIDARIKTKLDALKIAFKEAEKEDA